MFEPNNPFLTGSALDALSEWSNVLKSGSGLDVWMEIAECSDRQF